MPSMRSHVPGPCAGRQRSLFQDNVRFAFGGCCGPGAPPFVLLSALARGLKKSGAGFLPRAIPHAHPVVIPSAEAGVPDVRSRARWGREREARFWRPGRFCRGSAFDFGLRFSATGVALMELRFRRVPRPGCRSSQHPAAQPIIMAQPATRKALYFNLLSAKFLQTKSSGLRT